MPLALTQVDHGIRCSGVLLHTACDLYKTTKTTRFCLIGASSPILISVWMGMTTVAFYFIDALQALTASVRPYGRLLKWYSVVDTGDSWSSVFTGNSILIFRWESSRIVRIFSYFIKISRKICTYGVGSVKGGMKKRLFIGILAKKPLDFEKIRQFSEKTVKYLLTLYSGCDMYSLSEPKCVHLNWFDAKMVQILIWADRKQQKFLI